MTDDLDPFESPRLLLGSLRETVSEVEELTEAFLDDCLGAIRTDFDAATKENVIYCQLKNPFPDALRVKTYHVVSDCKHALDQSVGDGAVLLGRANASGIHFPIGKTPEDFLFECKRRLKNVNPDLKSFIENLDTSESGNPTLYKFLNLSGPNKHQRIVSVTTDSDMIINGSNLGNLSGPATLNIGKWNRRKNEIEFIRFGKGATLTGSGSNIYDIFKPVPKIVLKDGRPPFEKDLAITLTEFLCKCESIVSAIETETERILLARR